MTLIWPCISSDLKTVLDRTERVISLDFTRTNKVSARITDVDVVTDLMIHDIDLALYLNRSEDRARSHRARHQPGLHPDQQGQCAHHRCGRGHRLDDP